MIYNPALWQGERGNGIKNYVTIDYNEMVCSKYGNS